MAISRITGTAVAGSVADWVSLASVPSGASMYEFIASGTEGTYTVAGARYRVLQYRTAGSYTLTFDRAGKVEVLLVAGGGASGGHNQDNTNPSWKGAGGGGGLIQSYSTILSNTQHSLTVGAAGQSGGAGQGGNGGNTVWAGLFSAVGGGGGGGGAGDANGSVGGSGGGAAGMSANSAVGGAGTVGQGTAGANGAGGGGGGAGSAGSSGRGGQGLLLNFDGSFVRYAAGGNSSGDLYTNEGQCSSGGSWFGLVPTGVSPGGGSGAGQYVSGTSDFSGANGDRGIILVRWRIT